MRAAVPTILTVAVMALAGCAGTTSTAPLAPISPDTTTSTSPAVPPSPTASFAFPERTQGELGRSEFRNGKVTSGQWQQVDVAKTYVARAACGGAGQDFAYDITINGNRTTSGTFTCGHETINTVGKLSPGDRVDIGLTKVVAPIPAWVIVVPDPVG